MEAYEGADWVRISDDVPVDEDAPRRSCSRPSRPTTTRARRLGLRDRARAGRRGVRRGRGRPGPRPRGLTVMAGYTDRRARGRRRLDGGVRRASARCGSTPTPPAASRSRSRGARCRPGPGGKGSYGHRHKDQEEIYFVVEGTVQFKLGDEVFEVGPHTAVRVAHRRRTARSTTTDRDEAELVICSIRSENARGRDRDDARLLAGRLTPRTRQACA